MWLFKKINLEHKTIKLLEGNIKGKLLDNGFDNNFSDKTLKAKATKAKIDKWNYTDLKTSTHKRKQQIEWEANLQNGNKNYKSYI